MNSLENPISLSTKDKDTKASDSSKRKSRRIAGRVLNGEVKNEPAAITAESRLGKIVMSERQNREQLQRINQAGLVEGLSEIKNKEARIATMSNQDLLKLSEQIIVDGTNLRQIYETQLIGEKGLRRLVDEFTKGGDLKGALEHEILEREMDFERDPLMRDVDGAGSSITGTGQKALDQMIKKVEATLTNTQEETAFLKAKVKYEKREIAKERQHARVINNVFVAIITLLIAVIILLSLLKLS